MEDNMIQIETKEQAEAFLVLIGRRGKALEKGRETIVSYQKTFDEINLQIRKQLLAYLFYRIFDNQLPNEPNLIAIWLRAEEKGWMRDLARTILNGDQEWFEIICQKIREAADEVLKKGKGNHDSFEGFDKSTQADESRNGKFGLPRMCL